MTAFVFIAHRILDLGGFFSEGMWIFFSHLWRFLSSAGLPEEVGIILRSVISVISEISVSSFFFANTLLTSRRECSMSVFSVYVFRRWIRACR